MKWKKAQKVIDYVVLTPETRRKLNNKTATIVIKVQPKFKELAVNRAKSMGFNLSEYITYAIARDLSVTIL